MKLFHPINGCKYSNSTWYLKDFFGSHLVRQGDEVICSLCSCALQATIESSSSYSEEVSSSSDFSDSSDDLGSIDSMPDFSGGGDDFSGGGGEFGGGGASSDW